MARTTSPEEKTSNDWEAIESSPFAGAYIEEMYWLSRDTARHVKGYSRTLPRRLKPAAISGSITAYIVNCTVC